MTEIARLLLQDAAFAADAAAPAQQGGVASLMLPIVLFIVIFYFLIFRPQKKKQQQHDSMISSITRGNTVITAGGFYGRVSDVLEDSYIIEIADGVKVRILKSSISARKESPDDAKPMRPRRKRRKRERTEGADAPETGVTPLSMEDGVTEDESDALIGEAEGSPSVEAPEPVSLAKPEDEAPEEQEKSGI
jgi:preprotein translocase subunit YajC